MADLTRRGFLAQMSVTTGVGIVGGLGLRQLLSQNPQASGASAMHLPAAVPADLTPQTRWSWDNVSLAGPMMVHIRDVTTGEVAVMVGTQELIYRDPELVSRLVTQAASVSPTEA